MRERIDRPPLEEKHISTADGVDIACFECGDGPSIVMPQTPPFADTRFQWRSERLANNTPAALLARHWRVIQFDPRGCGASQRNVRDYSLAARVEDIKAVMDQYAVVPSPLYASITSVPAALAYASGGQARVSQLILLDPFAYGPDFYEQPQIKAMLALRAQDWEFYAQTVAAGISGWRGDEWVGEMAQLIRAASSPEAVRRFFDADLLTDVRSLLPEIAVPTLIIQSRRLPFLAHHVADRIASGIPVARLRVIDTTYGDELGATAIASAIADFLGEPLDLTPGRQEARRTPTGGTAVILVADIADSTALTERLGDAAFRDRARDLDTALRRIIREHSGMPIEGKLLGDGVLATFASARQAIEAALACARWGDDAGLPLHVGLHAGDVIREEGNVFGGAVNVASRISGLSASGEVLVSDTLRGLARTSAGVRFEDRGEQPMKGVGEPLRVWAVREGG